MESETSWPKSMHIRTLITPRASSTLTSMRAGEGYKWIFRPIVTEPTPMPARNTNTTIIVLVVSLPPRKTFRARCQMTWLISPAAPEKKSADKRTSSRELPLLRRGEECISERLNDYYQRDHFPNTEAKALFPSCYAAQAI